MGTVDRNGAQGKIKDRYKNKQGVAEFVVKFDNYSESLAIDEMKPVDEKKPIPSNPEMGLKVINAQNKVGTIKAKEGEKFTVEFENEEKLGAADMQNLLP